MSKIIDNNERKMVTALKTALQSADSIDIKVAFFYFSGFHLLAESLKNKKIRILIGNEIDSQCIPLLINSSLDRETNLEAYGYRGVQSPSILERKQNYIDVLIGLINGSDTFDSKESSDTFELFVEKIKDGSLEIRQSINKFHDKSYIFTHSVEHANETDSPGTVIMGSSNFTYNGLLGQGEANEILTQPTKFEEYKSDFDKVWSSSTESFSIATKDASNELISEIKEKAYFYCQPTPYEMYVRVLHEIYDKETKEKEIKTPFEITNGDYLDLEYQTDAVNTAIDRIDKHDGVIIADVVGLGKSIIGSTVAHNLGMNTVIISPPHLIPQWEDYKEKFGILGSKVFSSGKINEVYERYLATSNPILLIIDEAHRFRNEDTENYKKLHKICRSHPENKVILLTATPFNNSPQDIFALMKLFQTPGQSTIRNIDNLSLRFRDLISRYKNLRRQVLKTKNTDLNEELDQISAEQRSFLEPVVIRRSRLDLENITRYKNDLENQNISFPTINGPNLMEYDLGRLGPLYVDTLNQIGNEENGEGYLGARYKPSTYIVENKKFQEKYPELKNYDLKVGQQNLASFMRRLLVMRFESSKYSFKTTLERMIQNNKLIISWWENVNIVPIMKKGQLPDPENYEYFSSEDGHSLDDFEKDLEKLRESKGLLEIPIEWIDNQFIIDVKHDTIVLESIWEKWFTQELLENYDPKFEKVEEQILKLINKDPEKKVVIFSAYADTVEYIYNELTKKGMSGIFSFTSSSSNKESRKILLENFDASFDEQKQKNDYKILICTDALSEGVNLNRAGVVINYDIPYNPTRVIQRVGRINRINKKVFNSIDIFNFFPTLLGDSEVKIKQITTLKMGLINNVIGSDTKILTPEEDLQTFFIDEFKKASINDDFESWDWKFIEDYDLAKKDKTLMEKIGGIPHRTRISRKTEEEEMGIIFTKKGSSYLFIISKETTEGTVVTSKIALQKFYATIGESSMPVTAKFGNLFEIAKDKMKEKHALQEIRGRRSEALKNIEALRYEYPEAENYCTDLAKVIREYDDISEGTLKDIAQTSGTDSEVIYKQILDYVPEEFIKNVFERVSRKQNESETILLSEEFRN